MVRADVAGGRRARTRLDAVTWLSCYVALLLFFPSKLIVGALGSAGAPSMLFGLGSLLLWLLYLCGATDGRPPDRQPIRVALGVFLFSVGISYVLAMASPMSPDELSPADVAIIAVASWSGTLLLTHDGIPNRARLDNLLWRFAVCGGLIAILGLVQVQPASCGWTSYHPGAYEHTGIRV